MARSAKMVDVVVAGRMAKMRVVVSEPLKESGLKRAGEVVADAMRQAGDAELNTQPRSKYRNTLTS
jgi:hypothetical protein